MLQANSALLAYLPSDIEVFPDVETLIARLDDPQPCQPRMMLTLNSDHRYRSRLPMVASSFDPYTEELNGVLASRYDTIAKYTLRQGQIADEIVQASLDSEISVLLLVDGLGFRDVRDWPAHFAQPTQVLPCLVEGPSITRLCFPRIVGSPPVAAKLFDVGFTARIGFSYWNRDDNELTDRLFATIHDVRRCGTMAEVLTELWHDLQQHTTDQIFVQIVRMGLDVGAHHIKELPPVDALLTQLLTGVTALTQLLAQTHRRAKLFVTSDHGILWRSEFKPEIIGQAQGNPRFAHWREVTQQREKGLHFEVNGEAYFALPYPLLRRPLRIDEAGVHGGLSFQESIVPFVSIEVN